MTIQRCQWASDDPLMITYHDKEWGVPVHDDKKLFEFLSLEGAQAGLSWKTILHKRNEYRVAFDGFDPQIISGYTNDDVDRLMLNPGIVRNRLKINAVLSNAHAFIRIQKEFGGFDAFIRDHNFSNVGVPLVDADYIVPSQTEESIAFSKALKNADFKFVGPTIMYAFMQAIGLVNDHESRCFRRVKTSQ